MAYNKHDWITGELITADKMNAIEEGIDNIDEMANDTLIESNFKGRTKYLKGIDIDSSSGRGTLIFYDGANKANVSKIDFYTAESSSEQWKNLGFFTTEQGKDYIDQKFESALNNEWTDKELKGDSENPVQNKVINSAINDIKSDINTISNTLGNKLNITDIEEELDKNSTHPVQNKVIKEKLSLLNESISNIEEEITSIKDRFNTTTKTLWENKSTTDRIFKMGTTIELNDNISEYDYLDIYSTFWSTEIHSSFEVPKNEKKFWIRDVNIQDAQFNGGTTLSTAELQFSVDPSNNTIQISQNQLWKWDGKMSGQGPAWTGYYSDSTATGEAAISLNKIVGRRTAVNLDIDSIKADIKALQEAVDELKENNNDSSN